MTTRALVVDDEPPARRKVSLHLRGDERVAVIGEASNGLEAVEAIQELTPDLVFLDIQMPGLTGFEVVESVGLDAMPAVVFVTAYDEFALRAFEVEAVDYLLKPFDAKRFSLALDRALRRLSQQSSEQERLDRLLSTIRPGSRSLQRLVVRKNGRLVLVGIDEVFRFSARENYVEIYTAAGNHLIRETLTHLEARLDPDRFVRVHRSDIINLEYIREFQPWTHGDYLIVLKTGDRLRMSRRYTGRVIKDRV